MRRTLGIWAIPIAPFLLLCGLVALWHNTIPMFDEWNMAELLRRHDRGQLGVDDFWAQSFSDHRIVLPQMLIFGLARATCWNVGYEVVVSLLLALATFLLLVHLVRVSAVASKRQPIAIAGISAVVFSPLAWENWLWGWQIAWYLTNFGFVFAVAALCGLPPLGQRTRFLLAVAGAVVASLSLAHGLLVWVACLPAMLARREWRPWLLPWVGLMTATFIVYSLGYEDLRDVSGARFADSPSAFFAYAARYVLRPLSFDGGGTVPAAVALVGAIAVVCWRMTRMTRAEVEDALPWFVLIAFALLAAVFTAAGRSDLGLVQASASRYTTVSGLLIAGLFVLLVGAYDAAAARRARMLVAIAGAAVVALIGLGYINGVKQMERQYSDVMQPTRHCLRTARAATDQCAITTELDGVWPLVEFLRDHDLAGL